MESVYIEIPVSIDEHSGLSPSAQLPTTVPRRCEAGEQKVEKKMRLAARGGPLYFDDITAVKRPVVLRSGNVVGGKMGVEGGNEGSSSRRRWRI